LIFESDVWLDKTQRVWPKMRPGPLALNAARNRKIPLNLECHLDLVE